MRKLFLTVVFLFAAGAIAMMLRMAPSDIAITNAIVRPVAGAEGVFMATLSIENSGNPDRLIGASSSSAGHVAIMNPDGDLAMIVPGGGTAQLSSDGVHLMLSMLEEDLAQNSLLPLTLVFENAGDVSTRALISAPGEMAHGSKHEVPSDEAKPSVTILPSSELSADGLRIDIDVSDFEFIRVPDDAPHSPGRGHAHLYLNGLKLGRLYEPTASVGALSPGKYFLRIVLNTNDHRAYSVNGKIVASEWSFEIP